MGMSKLVFVIDDSQTVRKIIGYTLCRAGFQVLGFPDGIEAMRWLTHETGRIPDLVVLDICLPKMDGYEIARCFKEKPQFSSTVIVMLTRRDGLLDRLKGRLAGANDYVTKPFKIGELTTLVEHRLGGTQIADYAYFWDGREVFEHY
jgi:twitching motility two-component system response regulator PilG